MSRKRTEMEKITEILRLRTECGWSYQRIGAELNISKTSAHRLAERVKDAGVGWPLPDGHSGYISRLRPGTLRRMFVMRSVNHRRVRLAPALAALGFKMHISPRDSRPRLYILAQFHACTIIAENPALPTAVRPDQTAHLALQLSLVLEYLPHSGNSLILRDLQCNLPLRTSV